MDTIDKPLAELKNEQKQISNTGIKERATLQVSENMTGH